MHIIQLLISEFNTGVTMEFKGSEYRILAKKLEDECHYSIKNRCLSLGCRMFIVVFSIGNLLHSLSDGNIYYMTITGILVILCALFVKDLIFNILVYLDLRKYEPVNTVCINVNRRNISNIVNGTESMDDDFDEYVVLKSLNGLREFVVRGSNRNKNINMSIFNTIQVDSKVRIIVDKTDAKKVYCFRCSQDYIKDTVV